MHNSHSSSDSSVFPPAPPVRADVAEYIKAFDKPLTVDEKAAWMAEIAHLVLQGILPQDVYPALRHKIESLPTATATKDRAEEKLPGSDYVYPGPPKPYHATTTVFPNAVPLHEYEYQQSVRRQTREKSDSSFGVLLFIFGVFVLAGIAYGIGTWTMKNTKVNNPAGVPISTDAVGGEPVRNSKPSFPSATPVSVVAEIKIENPFESDFAVIPSLRLGPELLRVSDFKNGFVPGNPSPDNNWKNEFCYFYLEDAKPIIRNENDALVVFCEKNGSGTWSWLPEINFVGFSVKKSKQYRLTIEMRCDKEAEYIVSIYQRNDPFRCIGLGGARKIDANWKTYDYDFTAAMDESDAKMLLNTFHEGRTYEIRRVSLREILPPVVLENPFESEYAVDPSRLGPELLQVSNFSDGYRPRWQKNDWHWQGDHQGRRFGKIVTVSNVLKIDCEHSEGGLPQFFYEPISLAKGKKYRIEYETRSETTGNLALQMDTLNPKWKGFGRWQEKLETNWKTYQYDFVPDESNENVRLHFSQFTGKGIYEFRRISLREILPPIKLENPFE